MNLFYIYFILFFVSQKSIADNTFDPNWLDGYYNSNHPAMTDKHCSDGICTETVRKYDPTTRDWIAIPTETRTYADPDYNIPIAHCTEFGYASKQYGCDWSKKTSNKSSINSYNKITNTLKLNNIIVTINKEAQKQLMDAELTLTKQGDLELKNFTSKSNYFITEQEFLSAKPDTKTKDNIITETRNVRGNIITYTFNISTGESSYSINGIIVATADNTPESMMNMEIKFKNALGIPSGYVNSDGSFTLDDISNGSNMYSMQGKIDNGNIHLSKLIENTEDYSTLECDERNDNCKLLFVTCDNEGFNCIKKEAFPESSNDWCKRNPDMCQTTIEESINALNGNVYNNSYSNTENYQNFCGRNPGMCETDKINEESINNNDTAKNSNNYQEIYNDFCKQNPGMCQTHKTDNNIENSQNNYNNNNPSTYSNSCNRTGPAALTCDF